MKIKKILSLVLSLAMLCTMLTAFSVSVSAQGTAPIKVSNVAELQAAVNSVASSIVIDITGNIKSDDETSFIDIYSETDKNITINLNSHTIECPIIVYGSEITLTINGSGTIKGDASSVDVERGAMLFANNVQFIGADAVEADTRGSNAIYVDSSNVYLNNCYLAAGKSTGTADNVSAIGGGSIGVYAKDSTFVRGTGGSGVTEDTIRNAWLYDLDTEESLTDVDIKESPLIIGKGYTNINAITDNDGSPASKDTPVTATTTIPAPTYTVTIPETIDFGNQKQALEKYRNEINDQHGDSVNVIRNFTVTATGVSNLFNDLDDGKADYINVTATFDGILKGINNTSNTVPYILSQNKIALQTGDVIAKFYNDVDLESKDKTNTSTLVMNINRADIKNADSYQGTMTFTIAVADR